MSAHDAIEVRGLWKAFGASPRAFARRGGADLDDEALARRGWSVAVRDVDFSVHRGETFVVMGLSGSGKSTLIRCLTRLNEPTAGRVAIEGRDIAACGEAELVALRRDRMGMVFQHFALLPNLSVLGNVAFPLEIRGARAAEARERAGELVRLVGLEGREHVRPHALSGGQQQRVGIARSLATDPDFWFLDEPFSALDPLIRSDLQDELLRLQRTLAKTVVFITHDLDEAIRIADRVMIMEAGRVVQIATPETLVTDPATDYVARFVARVPRASVVRVRSLLATGSATRRTGDAEPVDASATVADVARRVVASENDLPVHDGGRLVGRLDRRRALEVLADAGRRAS